MIVFEVLFYMIYNIICSADKIKIKDDKITIVFDRHIYDYKFTNFSNQTGINLSIDFVSVGHETFKVNIFIEGRTLI
jgi:hypothetical protein